MGNNSALGSMARKAKQRPKAGRLPAAWAAFLYIVLTVAARNCR